MATFFNQASLIFKGVQTNSNIVSAEYNCGLGASSKDTISEGYGQNTGVSYVITLANNGTTPLNDVVISDNLGEYTFGTESVFPLEYVEGSLKFYLNGVLTTGPVVLAGPPLVISGINLPQGANALIVYEARTTEYAPLATGSTITNVATVNAEGILEPIVLTATVPVNTTQMPIIAKTICPDASFNCGENVNYIFTILNTGNSDIIATDNLILSDVFDPAIRNVSARYNDTNWVIGTNYTYDETTGTFASLPGQITVPGATYTQDPVSGAYTMTPGVTVIRVSGII